MTADRIDNAPVFRMPWPATAASFVAFGALAVTGKSYGVLTSLTALMLVSYVMPWRLSDRSWGAWMLRIVAFGTVIVANVAEPAKDRGHGFYDPAYIHAFGQLFAAELAVQCWRARPSGGTGGAVALLLSGIVFLTACNTFDHTYIRWFAPPYMIFILLAVGRTTPRLRPKDRRTLRLPARWIGPAFVMLALGVGFGFSHSLYAYRVQLYQIVRQIDDTIRGQRRETGFSERPVLGSKVSLQKSFTRVLRLEGAFPGSHLRGMAFENYEAGHWGPIVENRTLGSVRVSELNPSAPGPRCQITRLVNGYPYLFAPLNAEGLMPERVQEVERDATLVRVSAPAPYMYDVVVPRTAKSQGPLCVPPDTEARARCLAIPKSTDPRVRELAELIAGANLDSAERVQAVERYLRDTHTYSLEASPGKGDPISDFLLHEGRSAHCEYFASSAAILLRCAGVPSRYVIGFYAHESKGDGVMVVRQQDAHAWAEAWIEGTGWVTVEATPSDGMPDVIADSVPFWRRAWEWINDSALAVGDWLAELSFTQLGMLLGGLAAAVISLLWLREQFARRRKAKPKAPEYGSEDRALAPLAARFEALLMRGGAPCPPQCTWLEHVRALASRKASDVERAKSPFPPLDFTRAELFVNEYNRARFGQTDALALAGKLDSLLQTLEQAAGKA